MDYQDSTSQEDSDSQTMGYKGFESQGSILDANQHNSSMHPELPGMNTSTEGSQDARYQEESPSLDFDSGYGG